MSSESDEAVYTLQSIQEMLGVSRNVVLGFVKAGFVSPARGPRNTYRFGFQDVVLLRTAQTLRSVDIPVRRIHHSLKRLRHLLPSTVPLTGLRITAIGDDIVVREAGQDVALESGQLLLDFDVSAGPGDILTFPNHRIDQEGAAVLVAHAETIEAIDSEGAVYAYRKAIEIEPGNAAGYLNLGALLHGAAAFADALDLYDAAITNLPLDPELHYNRAIVLEDLGRIDDALRSYENCLSLSPGFADAHWNAARLYERLGVAQQALQHYSAYRRLQR